MKSAKMITSNRKQQQQQKPPLSASIGSEFLGTVGAAASIEMGSMGVVHPTDPRN